jgi:endoglucanase
MKHSISFLSRVVLIIVLISTQSCNQHSSELKQSKAFEIRKGVNISHWLSQSDVRGDERRNYFTEKDVEFIANAGYDHIRLPVDEEQLWDESGKKNAEAFTLLHNAIKWCLKNNLKTVVDMHILRSHYFNAQVKPLWTDTAEQVKFVKLWMDLSDELKQYPVSEVAYELLNEAVADNDDDWNNLIARVMKPLREKEPNRVIVIGSNRFQSPETFPYLKIPENDTNIILSFHFYDPLSLTHYKASWTNIKFYTGPVKYPGQIIEKNDLAVYPDSLTQHIQWCNGYFTIDTLEKKMLLPIEYAKKHNLPLYCGEYGCLITVPRESRLKWYEDVITIFDRNNIARANWDYKAEFGIFDLDTQKPDSVLIEIITGKRLNPDLEKLKM